MTDKVKTLRITLLKSAIGYSVTHKATLRALGFQDVKVYEPSWLGYAGTLSAPAEAETFFNPGPLLGRVSVAI